MESEKVKSSPKLREKDSEGKAILKADLEAGTSRMWNGDVFHGTAVMYAARENDFLAVQCDYELDTLSETRPREVRAYRQGQARKGAKQQRLRHDQLHNELVVIFGPEMSAKEAIRELHSLVRKIEKEGLLTGRDHTDEYIMETISG